MSAERENFLFWLAGFALGCAAVGFCWIATPNDGQARACRTVYQRAATVTDSLRLARASACPFKVEL